IGGVGLQARLDLRAVRHRAAAEAHDVGPAGLPRPAAALRRALAGSRSGLGNSECGAAARWETRGVAAQTADDAAAARPPAGTETLGVSRARCHLRAGEAGSESQQRDAEHGERSLPHDVSFVSGLYDGLVPISVGASPVEDHAMIPRIQVTGIARECEKEGPSWRV